MPKDIYPPAVLQWEEINKKKMARKKGHECEQVQKNE